MRVSDHRPDIPERVRPVCRRVGLFEVLNIALHPLAPVAVVAFVEAVDLSSRRNPDVFMRKQELADAGIQCKSMNAVPCRVDEDGARAIDDITGRDLFITGLETVLQRTLPPCRDAFEDAKNGTDRNVRVDIR